MCDADSGCPADDLLLCAHWGDVSHAERAAVWAHVHDCAMCRERLHDVEAVTRLAADYLARGSGEAERAATMRRAVHAWRQAEIHRTGLGQTRWWAPAASVLLPVLVALSVMLVQPQAVVLRADELLSRAANAESDRPAGTLRQARVRVSPATGLARRSGPPFAPVSLIREVGNGEAPSPVAVGPAAALLTALTREGLDWPLNVTAIRAWRLRQSGARDTVTFDGANWTLRTTTVGGGVSLVEVVAQWDTYRIVRQTVVVAGLGQVEVEELGEWGPRYTESTTVVALAPETLDEIELDVRLAHAPPI